MVHDLRLMLINDVSYSLGPIEVNQTIFCGVHKASTKSPVGKLVHHLLHGYNSTFKLVLSHGEVEAGPE
jgi:hypothetical protein